MTTSKPSSAASARAFRGLVYGVALLALGACQRYAVSLNDRVIYEPKGLFADYRIADPALKNCVRETIAEEGLTHAEQLTQLRCPAGTITHLEGIEIFQELRQLGLAGNQIRDPAPLRQLQKLTELDLRGNNTLDCTGLRTIAVATLHAPTHCGSD